MSIFFLIRAPYGKGLKGLTTVSKARELDDFAIHRDNLFNLEGLAGIVIFGKNCLVCKVGDFSPKIIGHAFLPKLLQCSWVNHLEKSGLSVLWYVGRYV